MRRLISTPMPIIEEAEEDEDYIDLVGMFEEAAQNWALSMVKSVEVQSEEEVKKSEVVLAHLADTEEEDDEEYKEDELFKWYEDGQIDKINAEKAKPCEEIVIWSELKQDWMVKPRFQVQVFQIQKKRLFSSKIG